MSSARRARLRVRVCFLAIAFVLSLFAGRLFQLQGVDANAYAAKALDDGTTTMTLHAARGEVLDRNGEPLATSVDAVAIIADPKLTAKNATSIARILANRLGIDYFDSVERLRTPDSRFIYLDRKVPTFKASAVMKAVSSAGYPGLSTERDTLRTYPGGSLAANVLGLVTDDDKGAAGLERTYQETLAGKDGRASFETAPGSGLTRIPLANDDTDPAVPGQGIQTTIDRDLQWYADRRLRQEVKSTKSDWGLAITVDLRSMQVLNLSQVPTFDANKPAGIDPDTLSARAVQDVYEPGSVQKVVTMAALADQGLVTPTTKVKVPSSIDVDDFTIGDYWDHGTLKLTAAGIIAKSSNMGTVLLSQQMSDQDFHDYLERFGFGSPTRVGLPGESGGILPDASTWSRSNHATISFGQGISVTAMQEVAAVAAIANGGEYVQPSLVSGTVDADGVVTPVDPPRSHRAVSKKAASEVTTMMEAVTNEGGTATNVAIPGYRVAGKTGTAWRVDPDTGRYVRGENTVSFMGFAPADHPRFLTYVVLDNPAGGGSGSLMAGPVFHDVLRTALERYGVVPTGSHAPKTPLEW